MLDIVLKIQESNIHFPSTNELLPCQLLHTYTRYLPVSCGMCLCACTTVIVLAMSLVA